MVCWSTAANVSWSVVFKMYSYFEMQSMVFISYDSSQPGAMLDVDGDLSLRQKWPLGNSGIDTRYNVSVFSGVEFIHNVPV